MKHRNTYRYNYTSSYSTRQYAYNEPKKSRKYLLILPVLIIAITVGVLIKTNLSSKNKTAALDKQDSSKSVLGSAEDKTDKVVHKEINEVVMGQQINSVIAKYPNMQIGVSVINLSDQMQYTYGVENGFLAASTAKLITATLYLHKVENGEYTLTQKINNDTAKNQLESMIVDSNNDAWYAFNNLLTKPTLKSWTLELGMKSYDTANNIDTPSDIAILLSKLYQNKILNKENTQLLLSYMQDANEAQYIVSDVPEGIKVYHKAGWLDDRVHDAAIIDDGKNPYVLVIYSKVNSGVYNSTAGKQLYKDITAATLVQFVSS